MPNFFSAHSATLERAVEAIADRTYWSAYPEHPKAYGDDAPTAGQAAFNALLGAPFALDQVSDGFMTVAEASPYGIDLGIEYPATDVDTVVAAAVAAMKRWGTATPDERAGVCLEILDRLSRSSFEMAHAVMATTGQSFLMAFQAGGPHALDRALEAIAYTYAEQRRVPDALRWEKPQGSRPLLAIDKRWIVRPRGVAVTIGVSTFPTWNGYPGIFASLAAGNPVIVKPHPETILPLALVVRTARAVLAEVGFDLNVVQLLVDTPEALVAKDLVMRPEIGIVDYTGGSRFGNWLEANVTHAEVYTEKAGVNSVILDSARDLSGVFRNLSVSMTMYSGQMCTTPQNLFVPEGGVTVDGEVVPYDDVVAGFVGAIEGLLGDDGRAAAILGALKGEATLARLDSAPGTGRSLLESRVVPNPEFPDATVRTPAIVEVDADSDAYRHEMFGPVIYVVKTESIEDSIERAKATALESGAITWLAYTVDDTVTDDVVTAAVDAGVSVAFNLTGGLFVNQSAAFSDFHVTGANAAGNASLTDPAFVARRFRVVGIRTEPA
ncbi:Phenylacetic acid degradation protein PaaN2, ring-opening aldehyde dehydrogenase [hydrothermal vent metagenome]|uniref:Phenylacetic acid degradation protein PaaN2, ring-opening aldehyde dehydrogenase n=1 Tax=hydrothermal vent metagenome TaxID=652676 RepID=A0A3B0SKS0_9ZZZZ